MRGVDDELGEWITPATDFYLRAALPSTSPAGQKRKAPVKAPGTMETMFASLGSSLRNLFGPPPTSPQSSVLPVAGLPPRPQRYQQVV